MSDYIRDGAEIYRRSFATIRAETDLTGHEPILERTIVRMIHACGMVDLVGDVQASPGFAPAAEAALRAGAPVLCDTNMVASGITRSRLPAANDVVCTLTDPRVAALAASTRNDADRRGDRAVARAASRAPSSSSATPRPRSSTSWISSPTADPAPQRSSASRSASSARRSRRSRSPNSRSGLEFLVVHGRRGGSAIAAAAVNALASAVE